jgi:hypothetical protein
LEIAQTRFGQETAIATGEQKRKKSTHVLRWGGKQQKLGLHGENSPSSEDFYHLQLPQM